MNNKSTHLTYALLMSLGTLVIVGSVGLVTGSIQVGKPQSSASYPTTLTVSKGGNGSGTVTSPPSSLNCGSTCVAQFPHSTYVDLVATPASGSQVVGWVGCTPLVTDIKKCRAYMYGDQKITTVFGAPAKLTVALIGAGSVSGTGSPGSGVSFYCSSTTSQTCAKTFPYNTTVYLIAKSVSSWGGWTDCPLKDPQNPYRCIVKMTRAASITVSFKK